MRIVVKVGTSTLAHPSGLLNIRHTEDLVKVWSDIQNAGHQLIVVSSAATGLGVGKLQIEKPSDIITKQAAAGVDMIITNGAHAEVLYDIVEGKPVGTRFAGHK